LPSREYLTEAEVVRLIEVARDNRWGHRDSTMLLIAFRHGLRASELVDLRWERIDLESAILHVRRLKQRTPATHPLTGRELRALPPTTARTGTEIALRLCKRTWRSVLNPGLSGDGGAGGQGSRLLRRRLGITVRFSLRGLANLMAGNVSILAFISTF
jgi:integrase